MTTIITRNNAVAGTQPTAGTVAKGELCVNVGDGNLYSSSDGSDIITVGGGGGGSGDLPAGTSDGQMLKWTATGAPGWFVTDVIKTTSDGNIAIGGPQYSSGYKFTVNGASAFVGDILCGNGIGGAWSFNSAAVSTDPSAPNQVARKSYLDATYAFKSNTVTLNATQTITGAKTFSAGLSASSLTVTGGGFSIVFSGLATGSNQYLRLGTTGAVFTSSTLAAADVEIAPGENLADTIAALKAQIIVLGGSI